MTGAAHGSPTPRTAKLAVGTPARIGVHSSGVSRLNCTPSAVEPVEELVESIGSADGEVVEGDDGPRVRRHVVDGPLDPAVRVPPVTGHRVPQHARVAAGAQPVGAVPAHQAIVDLATQPERPEQQRIATDRADRRAGSLELGVDGRVVRFAERDRVTPRVSADAVTFGDDARSAARRPSPPARLLPTKKNVAGTSRLLRMSSTRSVTPAVGPLSNVRLTTGCTACRLDGPRRRRTPAERSGSRAARLGRHE